jgi:hypothetical protein
MVGSQAILGTRRFESDTGQTRIAAQNGSPPEHGNCEGALLARGALSTSKLIKLNIFSNASCTRSWSRLRLAVILVT